MLVKLLPAEPWPRVLAILSTTSDPFSSPPSRSFRGNQRMPAIEDILQRV